MVEFNERYSRNAGRSSAKKRELKEKKSLNQNENETGIKKRVFTINRNIVRSTCISLYSNKKHFCLLFLTFTLPIQIPERQARKAWNALIMNLRNRYGVNAYVWVKEYQTNGRVHYHILIDKPYICIVKLQKTWNSVLLNNTSINEITTNCSVRLGERPRVYSINRVANYLAKYIAKANPKKQKDKEKAEALKQMGIIDGEFSYKCYGFTQNIEYCVTISNKNSHIYENFLEKCLFSCEILKETEFCIIFLTTFTLSTNLILKKQKFNDYATFN